MCTVQVQDNYQGWFWVGGFHQWLVGAGVGREAAWGGRCCRLLPRACFPGLPPHPPCCRRPPPPCGSATARRTGGSWPGWCPDTSSSPGSSVSSSRWSTASDFHSFIFLTSTRIFFSQTIFSRWASPLYPGMGTTTTTTMSRCTRSSTYRTTLK